MAEKTTVNGVDDQLAPVDDETYLDNVVTSAMDIPLDQVATGLNKDVVTTTQCNNFLDYLSKTLGIHITTAFIAVALLFLKGAANTGAPERMGVDVIDNDGNTLTVTKYDLVYACNQVMKHKFLRRVAEALALPIGNFAQKNNLNGDLAIGLNNNLLAKGEPPLTSQEKAWASSFNQNLPNLEKLAGERVPALLAADFNRRFKKGTQKTQKTGAPSETPRQWRKGDPKKEPNKGKPVGDSKGGPKTTKKEGPNPPPKDKKVK